MYWIKTKKMLGISMFGRMKKELDKAFEDLFLRFMQICISESLDADNPWEDYSAFDGAVRSLLFR